MEVNYKEAFIQLIDFLEKIERENGIKYYLVGGILTSLYSELRTTQDIDFVNDIFSANHDIERYIDLLKKNGFFPIQDWESTAILAKNIQMLQFFDKQERIKFDNYIINRQSTSKYKKIGPIALDRRVRVNFLDIKCWATSKEDFILSKLVYGGWQDFADALGCRMRFGEKLDISYMEKISKVLGIQKEFELLESGIDDPDEYFKKLNNY